MTAAAILAVFWSAEAGGSREAKSPGFQDWCRDKPAFVRSSYVSIPLFRRSVGEEVEEKRFWICFSELT